MGLKRPGRRRDNPKNRAVTPRPDGIDLPSVLKRVSDVGSVYHKDMPSFAGAQSVPRPDASICPRELAWSQDRIEAWLRGSIREGRCGGWDRGFPRYVWHREDGLLFEARLGSPGSGEYHGYPLETWQHVRNLND